MFHGCNVFLMCKNICLYQTRSRKTMNMKMKNCLNQQLSCKFLATVVPKKSNENFHWMN